MTNIQGRNNILLGCAVALAVFLLAIPVQWFSLTNHSIQVNGPKEVAALLAHNFPSGSINVHGTNGHITFLVKLPIWLLLSISSFGIIMLTLNILEVTTLPRAIPALCLAIPGIYYLIPLFSLGSGGSIGPGPIMALLATLLGLALAFKKTQAVIPPQPTLG